MEGERILPAKPRLPDTPPRAVSLRFRGCPVAGGGCWDNTPLASPCLEARGWIYPNAIKPHPPAIPLASPEAFGVRESIRELSALSTELEGVLHLLEHLKVSPDAEIAAAFPPVHGRPAHVGGVRRIQHKLLCHHSEANVFSPRLPGLLAPARSILSRDGELVMGRWRGVPRSPIRAPHTG